uniref:Uncharacterized protein n=1 Tax=Zea mays TaxID=4577 RepID=B6U8K9_MAIZE|nr:hypothetical protein [Zea mays]
MPVHVALLAAPAVAAGFLRAFQFAFLLWPFNLALPLARHLPLRASRSAASRPSTTPSCGATRPPAPGPSRRGATGTPRSAPCRGRARMPPSRVLWPCSSTSPTDAACFHSHSARTTYRAIRSVACVLATSDLSIFLRILALGV